jgi:hypothetical protein
VDSPNNDPVPTARQITALEQTLNDALGTGAQGLARPKKKQDVKKTAK